MVLVVMRLLAAVAMALLQGQAGGEEYVLSWYGSEGDGYLESRHGAAWNGKNCGLPDLVDGVHYGAAGPRWMPYCKALLVCQGRCIVVVIVDRQRDDWLFGRPHLDLWPAAAEALDMVEVGIVVGRVYGADD